MALNLQYEPTPHARPIVIENDGPTTRIIVLMSGPYVPIPKWVADADIFSLILAPLILIVVLLFRLCLRLKKPPRAVFEITAERMNVLLRDPTNGETRTFDCPRTAIMDARTNRFERGLWLNVAGQMKETVLADLPALTIALLDAALNSALAIPSANKQQV